MDVEHSSWTQSGGWCPRASAQSAPGLIFHLGSRTSRASLCRGRSHPGFCAGDEISSRAVLRICASSPRAATAITKAAA